MNLSNGRPLAGKSAFVTGGSGAIGQACARSLLLDGASVTLMSRSQKKLERTKETIREAVTEGAELALFTGNARDKADVENALAEARRLTGSLDIVIPTVGGGEVRPLLMHSEESFREALDLNILSAFIAIRYATPIMAETGGGSIVCISSDSAKLAFPWLTAYSSGKSGLEGLVRSAAEELSRYNIRVNAVRPGLTRSESTSALFENPEIYKAFADEKPLGRLGEPEDIAAGVRYLAGPESSWVTGQSFAIEGGNELRKAPELSAIVRHSFGDDAFDKVLRGKAPFD